MKDKDFDQIEFWAHKCRQNVKECQRQVNKFVNAQIEIANSFYKRLAKTRNGRQKIMQLKRIS